MSTGKLAVGVIALALIYTATLTSDYYWDGVTFALQIEKVAAGERRARLLFHQNHLLYNAAGFLIYKLALAAGIAIRAIHLLQVVNALIAALGVGVLFRIVERLTGNSYAAVASSAALAFSAVWWKMATDADSYVASIFFILLSAHNLLGPSPRAVVAGLLLACAMLLHELASLFFPAALVLVLSSKSAMRSWRFAAGFSAVAWGVTVAVYYACARFAHGISGLVDLVRWAMSNQTGVSVSANPLRGFALFPKLNFDLIFGHNFSFFRSHSGWAEWAFAGVAIILTVIFVLKARQGFRQPAKKFESAAFEIKGECTRAVPMVIAWIAAYALFLLFWEPGQPYYRIFYSPALALALGLAINSYHSVTGRGPSQAALYGVAALAFFNMAFYIFPHMRVESNQVVAAARSAREIFGERAIIYFADRTEFDTAFEYFASGTEWRRLSPAERRNLDSQIERARDEGRSVWLNNGAITSVDPGWLARRADAEDIYHDFGGKTARYVKLIPER